MALDIQNYYKRINYWEQLKKYLSEFVFQNKIALSDNDVESTLKKSRRCFQKLEKDSFKKFTVSLSKSGTKAITRRNFVRLCFALIRLQKLKGKEAVENANRFLQNYMCTNELSSRSLLEFVVIQALNLNLSWQTVCDICSEYQDRQQKAPLEYDTSQTRMFSENIPAFTKEEDLRSFLARTIEEASFTFADTNNTCYAAMFDDVVVYHSNGQYMFADSNSLVGLPKDRRKNKSRNKNLQETEEGALTPWITDYYNQIFGLRSLDGDIMDENGESNYLTDKEVQSLSGIFPDTFVSYIVFWSIVQRKRSVEISPCLYLLHLLVTMESSSADPEKGVDFLDHEAFWEYLDRERTEIGFPPINPNVPFEALVIDVYNEVYNNADPLNDTSEDIRRKYLYSLRDYLKKISALYTAKKA